MRVYSGLVSNSRGGCASLQLIGNFTDYLPLTANGLTSIGFPSVFPLSFQFLPTTPLYSCLDTRNEALAFNVIITALLFLVLRPKPVVCYWCLVCIGFWHVTLFSQPQASPPPLDTAFQEFLPALFVAYAFWRLAFRFTMPAFRKAPIEASVWYLAPFWTGVLANITLDKIPIDRLTASDINQQPGGLTALIIIVLILLAIVVNQVRVIRKTGYLPQYLGWYVAGGLVTLVLSQLPGLELRIHHYILAMVLIPGTAFPTRLSAIYQAFLLGLFLNGIAAFGFDSVLQTVEDVSIPLLSPPHLQGRVLTCGPCFTAAARRSHRFGPPRLRHKRHQLQRLYPLRQSNNFLERVPQWVGRLRAPRRRCRTLRGSGPELLPRRTRP